MNKVVLMGRLVADVEASKKGDVLYARYRLAVDRRFKKDGEQQADFIPCVAFGKNAEFAEKFLTKGQKIAVVGRIQTGSYTNKDGQKVYTTDILVEEHYFAESKGQQQNSETSSINDGGWMDIPGGVEDEGLPFN